MDFQTRRQRLKRRLLRVIIPFGFVLLIVAATLTIAMVTYFSNRRDTLALSVDMLTALDRQIHSEVNAYLMPASNLVRIGAETSREYIDEIWSPTRTPLGLQVIKTYPQLSSFLGANPQGNFIMHRQNSDGTIDTKVIERGPSGVKTTWAYRDAGDRVVRTETAGDDNYDPRVRPWYQGALRTRNLFWSDTYIFFSDQKPGITVSYPVFSQNDQLLAVIAIDIKLEQISAFLDALKIGENGRAMIIEDDGKVVAYPELDRIVKGTGDTLETMRLDELGDPVLTRAFNRFKIEGHGQRALVVDDRRYLNTVTSLKSTVGRAWSVMIIVPEEDYVGFLRENLNKVLLMTGGIVIVTAILAVMLVLHGLRTDRRVIGVLERQHELEAQSRAFSELASKTALWDPDDVESLKELTEIVAVTMAVRCVSAWGYDEDQRILTCEDSFDRGTNGHTGGTMLKVDDYPQLLEDLIQGEAVVISDTAADPRTSELYRTYLEPLGCRSLLAVPVMPGGRLAGAVWLEHEETIRKWASEDLSFGRAIASMLALRLSATRAQYTASTTKQPVDKTAELSGPDRAARSKVTFSAVSPAGLGESARPGRSSALPQGRGRKISFSERLHQWGFTPDTAKADVCENVTVLMLQFTDALALAAQFGKDKSITVADHLVRHCEDLFHAHRIDYWKMASNQIVCAAGMREPSNRHAHVIADLALVLQDKCGHLFADLDRPMDFKIGIDTGGVIGNSLGRRQKSYNIWGEAVSTAAMMADHGVYGGIQVSETAYRRLQQDYLFKARGRYYLPKIGEIYTFILTGRI